MCPFGELTAPSALSKIEAEMSAARAEIERIAGKTLFDTANWASANCVSTDPVEG
jgi:flagellin-like hook-associated protein FlgL